MGRTAEIAADEHELPFDELLIDDLLKDTSTQMRAKMNEATMADYTDIYRDKGPNGLPVPDVCRDPKDPSKIWLTDGWHRVRAAKKAGLKTLVVSVTLGSHREALLAACKANSDHGLPRTAEDKRNVLCRYLEIMGKKSVSQGKIAADVGCSQAFVSNYLREQKGKKAPPKSITGEKRAPKSPNGSKAKGKVTPVSSSVDRVRTSRLDDEPPRADDDKVHLAAMRTGLNQIDDAYKALIEKYDGSFQSALRKVEGLRELAEELDDFVLKNITNAVTHTDDWQESEPAKVTSKKPTESYTVDVTPTKTESVPV